MKFGMRKPSIKESIAARTSVKRYIRHSLGVKAPRGWGWISNPKKPYITRSTVKPHLVYLIFLSFLNNKTYFELFLLHN